MKQDSSMAPPRMALQRLVEAALRARTAEWDANHHGRYLGASSVTLTVPQPIYDKLTAAYDELREARQAALERAFL